MLLLRRRGGSGCTRSAISTTMWRSRSSPISGCLPCATPTPMSSGCWSPSAPCHRARRARRPPRPRCSTRAHVRRLRGRAVLRRHGPRCTARHAAASSRRGPAPPLVSLCVIRRPGRAAAHPRAHEVRRPRVVDSPAGRAQNTCVTNISRRPRPRRRRAPLRSRCSSRSRDSDVRVVVRAVHQAVVCFADAVGARHVLEDEGGVNVRRAGLDRWSKIRVVGEMRLTIFVRRMSSECPRGDRRRRCSSHASVLQAVPPRDRD